MTTQTENGFLVNLSQKDKQALREIILGGPYTIMDIIFNNRAQLDFSRIQTIASPVTLTGSYQYVYSNSGGVPFYFPGGFFSQDSGAWATGESVEIVVEVQVDGTNWEVCWPGTTPYTLTAAANPLSLAVPSGVSEDVSLNIPMGFWVWAGGCRVGIKQSVVGAGYGVWSHTFGDGYRRS